MRAEKPLVNRIPVALVAGLSDLAGIVREMLAIPWGLWLAIAERAGRVVLAGWAVVRPLLLAALDATRAALRFGQRELTPARALIAVALAMLVAIAVAEFLDYRAVSVGTPEYSGVERVAPAPEVEQRTAGSAHSNLLLPVAVAGIAVLAFAARGRWRLARLLVPVGLTVVAVCILNDAPKGLDEAGAATEYEGAEATLLGPFWVQLFAGATLAGLGLMLAPALRTAEPAPARSSRRRLEASTA